MLDYNGVDLPAKTIASKCDRAANAITVSLSTYRLTARSKAVRDILEQHQRAAQLLPVSGRDLVPRRRRTPVQHVLCLLVAQLVP